MRFKSNNPLGEKTSTLANNGGTLHCAQRLTGFMIVPSRSQSIPSPFLNKSWPRPLCDASVSSIIGDLPSCHKKIQSQLETSGDILIRVVTWNQQARESPECLTKLLFPHKYHIVAVGTQ